MNKESELIKYFNYHKDLLLGRRYNSELVLASRASIAGIFSMTVMGAGVINGRMDSFVVGSTLLLFSGLIMRDAVNRS